MKELQAFAVLFRSGSVFCLLFGVSSDYAQPITGRVTEVTAAITHIPKKFVDHNSFCEPILMLRLRCSGRTVLIPWLLIHYGDVIMGAIASQITSLTIVYWTVYSDADQIKYQSSTSLALCGEFTDLREGNSPGTGEFPTQMASNAENVSIWWRHHVSWLLESPDHQ